MSHTPGPWTVHKAEPWKYVILHNGPIAYAGDVGGESGNEIAAANARLIAAAPELLEALEELIAEADKHPGWEGHKHANSLGFSMARAAIAKATGE